MDTGALFTAKWEGEAPAELQTGECMIFHAAQLLKPISFSI